MLEKIVVESIQIDTLVESLQGRMKARAASAVAK
jgi:hypothetical protein